MNAATSSATVCYLWQLFAQSGIPETIVSDNGTQFVAAELVQRILSHEWCLSHPNCSVPSIIKWFGGENCPGIQTRPPKRVRWYAGC